MHEAVLNISAPSISASNDAPFVARENVMLLNIAIHTADALYIPFYGDLFYVVGLPTQIALHSR